MEEWKEYRLGDLIVLSSGGTPNKSNCSYWGGDIPWISAKAMYDDYLYSSDMTITREGLNNGSKLAPINSILLLTRGSGLFNRIPVCLVKREMAFNQDVKCIESINQNIVSTLFLFYWLMGNKKEISNILETTGIGAGRIDTERLKNIHIKLPPIQIQQSLIKYAESLMLKIEVNRRINENLEQQAQALFKSWFVDFEPFRDGEFVESELGMIPKGWKVGNIYPYVNVIYGAPYKSSLFNDKGDGLPLIRIRDLKTFSPQFYTPEILPQTEYVVMGDVVAGMDAEFVPCLWLGERGVLNQRCCKFVPKFNEISNYFVLYWLKPELEFVQSYKTGTTVSHLGKSDIDRFVVVVPPIEKVQQYSTIAESLLNEKIKLSKEILELSQLRDTLLPKLMSGELDVNNVAL